MEQNSFNRLFVIIHGDDCETFCWGGRRGNYFARGSLTPIPHTMISFYKPLNCPYKFIHQHDNINTHTCTHVLNINITIYYFSTQQNIHIWKYNVYYLTFNFVLIMDCEKTLQYDIKQLTINSDQIHLFPWMNKKSHMVWSKNEVVDGM